MNFLYIIAVGILICVIVYLTIRFGSAAYFRSKLEFLKQKPQEENKR